jgi:hypothetical protein
VLRRVLGGDGSPQPSHWERALVPLAAALTPEEAEQALSVVTDPSNSSPCSEALAALLPRLPADRRTSAAHPLVRSLADAGHKERVEALAALARAGAVAPDLLPAALDGARAIGDLVTRAKALLALLPSLLKEDAARIVGRR